MDAHSETPHTDAPAYRNILFCTDFSENADFAFTFAVAAAKAHVGANLFLLHVIPEPEAQFWKTYMYEVDNVDEKAKNDLDKRTDAYRNRVPEGVPFDVVYRIGQDWEEILACSEEMEIDLIVMGRHGRGGLQKMFFGNVTEKVTRKAACPILIVPGSYQETVRQRN